MKHIHKLITPDKLLFEKAVWTFVLGEHTHDPPFLRHYNEHITIIRFAMKLLTDD